MSDVETNTDPDSDHISFTNDEPLNPLRRRRQDSPAPAVPPQREGLPGGYRMRADEHYVDHLSAKVDGPLVRLIPIQEIDSITSSSGQLGLDPLIRSIRSHGVLQPLLVRRGDSRYSVIAGRRRLAAARVAGVSGVPCIVHQVDDAEAEALATADNLRSGAEGTGLETRSLADHLRGQLRTHLATVQTAAGMLADGESLAPQVVMDLVRAHTARAAWLLDATELVANGTARRRHPRMLAGVVEQVLDVVAPEGRLARTPVRAQFADSAASALVDDDSVGIGLAGATLAVMVLVEQANAPSLAVQASRRDGGTLALEVVGSPVTLTEAHAGRFFDPTWTERPGGWSALIGALAAQAAAERRAGSATFRLESGGVARLKLLLPNMQ